LSRRPEHTVSISIWGEGDVDVVSTPRPGVEPLSQTALAAFSGLRGSGEGARVLPANRCADAPLLVLDLASYLVYYSTTMITINVQEAKTHLSHYLDEVAKGESFILCKRNKPIAEIRPITSRAVEQRPIGLGKRTFTVPASFFDELPEETISLFTGETP
jgi:prevent-host-death family protein